MATTVTAAQVNELRNLTGAGLMDCKKALTEANGDVQAAIDFLRGYVRIEILLNSARVQPHADQILHTKDNPPEKSPDHTPKYFPTLLVE